MYYGEISEAEAGIRQVRFRLDNHKGTDCADWKVSRPQRGGLRLVLEQDQKRILNGWMKKPFASSAGQLRSETSTQWILSNGDGAGRDVGIARSGAICERLKMCCREAVPPPLTSSGMTKIVLAEGLLEENIRGCLHDVLCGMKELPCVSLTSKGRSVERAPMTGLPIVDESTVDG